MPDLKNIEEVIREIGAVFKKVPRMSLPMFPCRLCGFRPCRCKLENCKMCDKKFIPNESNVSLCYDHRQPSPYSDDFSYSEQEDYDE